MIGMTAKQLRDWVQRATRYEGLRLEMGSGVVLQYFPEAPYTGQEIYIEGNRQGYRGLWNSDYFYNDAEVNSFFDAMGGIVHVLEIIE